MYSQNGETFLHAEKLDADELLLWVFFTAFSEGPKVWTYKSDCPSDSSEWYDGFGAWIPGFTVLVTPVEGSGDYISINSGCSNGNPFIQSRITNGVQGRVFEI